MAVHFAQYRGVYWAGRQADRIVVGAIAGASLLGLYDSARRWSWYAFHELFQSVSDVMVASLSRARANVERFRSFFRHGLMAFLVPPLAAIAFVFVEADATVRVLLGDRWLDAIPIVRIMCGAAFFDALSRLTMWLYTAEGRTRQQFRWSVITTPSRPPGDRRWRYARHDGCCVGLCGDDRSTHGTDGDLLPARIGHAGE